ncbi:hypothetical protein [Terrisporobacter sp.]
MKKGALVFFLSVLSIIWVGCGALKKEEPITISKDNNNAVFTTNMGGNYKISNLMEGQYNLQIYAKEYEFGKLKNEHNLFKVKIGDKKDLYAGVYFSNLQENQLFAGINGGLLGSNLKFFKKADKVGIAMSTLDDKRNLQLNKEIAICAYSIGNNMGDVVSSVDLSDDIRLGENKGELIVYLKITPIK